MRHLLYLWWNWTATLTLAFFLADSTFGQDRKAFLFVHAPHFQEQDTLVLYVWDEAVHPAQTFKTRHRVFKSGRQEEGYGFQLDSISPYSWCSLGKDNERMKGRIANPILDMFLLCPGDSILISVIKGDGYPDAGTSYDSGKPIILDSFDLRFSGKGSGKYEAQWKMNKVIRAGIRDTVKADASQMKRRAMANLDKVEKAALGILNRYFGAVDPTAFQLLEAECIGKVQYKKLRVVNLNIYSGRRHQYDMAAFQHSCQIYREMLMETKGEAIPDNVRARSPHYLMYLTEKLRLDQMVLWGIPSNDLCYDLISEMASGYSPLLRDRLLTCWMLANKVRMTSGETERILPRAIGAIKDRPSLAILRSLNTSRIGSPLPDMALPGKNDQGIPLRGFKGKVVLMDFYYAACAPCQSYFREIIKPVLEDYKNDPRIVFVSISIDNRDTFLRTLKSGKFEVDGSIHLYTANKGALHPLIDHYKISAYPTPMVFDGNSNLFAFGKELRAIDGLRKYIEEALQGL